MTCSCMIILTYAQPKITRVEYYIDVDPGYGKAFKVKINSNNNIQDKTIKLNPDTLSEGIHVIGVRAKDANDAWSLDNKWLFLVQSNGEAKIPKIAYIEYYIDTDKGYGINNSIAFTQGTDLKNLQLDVNPDTLSAGIHIIGIRARDANNAWSLDNKWLFLVQKPAAPVPDLKAIEYYIDADPGYGKGTPIAINSVNNISNFNLPLNVSALKAGIHVLYIRSKDANDAWSLDNVDSFNIAAAINPATIVINSITATTVCAGSNVKVSYQANGKYDSGNVFKVQLSNKSGVFNSSAKIIGNKKSKADEIINCTIAADAVSGTNYRLRIISTSPVDTGLISVDSLKINALPGKPIITSNPVNTTELCPGTLVTLTSSSAGSNLWNTGATTDSILVANAGSYYVTVSNTGGCSSTSDTTVVSYTTCAKPNALKTKNTMSTSATFTWKRVACAIKYKVQYRLVGTTTYTSANATDSFYNVTNLLTDTTYEWRVKTVCSSGIESGYSKLVSFKTTTAFVNAIADNEANVSVGNLNARIIPNPAGSEAIVLISKNRNAVVSVNLSDVAGKVLWKAENISDDKIELPVKSIADGTYFVTISNALQKKTLQFVKQQ